MTYWLADKSALTRIPHSPDGSQWQQRIERGLVRVTTATRLEIGYSVQAGSQIKSVQSGRPLSLMPVEYLTPAVEDRAVAVQALLGSRGHHRGPSIPDLLIAAAAEIAGLTVLHVDKDFDTIADLTGQPVERLTLATEH